MEFLIIKINFLKQTVSGPGWCDDRPNGSGPIFGPHDTAGGSGLLDFSPLIAIARRMAQLGRMNEKS
jgi:hypothetical protein